MKRKFWAIATFILLAFPVMFAFSQEDATSPLIEITGINASDTPSVVITANVYDTLGQPEVGLTAEDFTLSGQLAEFGQIVSVENLADDNLPFAVVLVIDISSSMAGRPLELVQNAASQFIESISEIDPVAIMTFGNDVTLVQDFTTDKATALNAINNLFYGGRTALYDAAVEGVELGSNAPVSRRAVILLSDGAEFGGVSSSSRDAATLEAQKRGVPVYTIGLGFGTDRSYLEQLSGATNARYFESPTPDELEQIYQTLADLFRSQYVITLEANVPLDGTEYPFILSATTAEGQTNDVSGVVRAPIPVPIVEAPPSPDSAISSPTDFAFTIKADDELATVEATIDGETLTTFEDEPYTVTIDPFQFTPGSYEIALTATDIDGDSDSASVTFDVDAIPAVVDLGTDLSAMGEISDPIELVLSIDGQTPTRQVTFLVDGNEASRSEVAEEYRFVLDPFNYTQGEHTLAVEVLSESGALSTIESPFTTASLSPRFSLDSLEIPVPVDEARTLAVAIQTQGDNGIGSASAMLGDIEVPLSITDNSVELSLDPLNLPPGNGTINLTVTDNAGASTTTDLTVNVPALAPDVTIENIADSDVIDGIVDIVVTTSGQTPVSTVVLALDGTEIARSSDEVATFSLDPLAFDPGAHTLTVRVTNQGGVSIEESFDFEFAMSVYLTATPPTPTPTVNVEATDQAGTAIAVQTVDAESTQIAASTAEAQMTLDAESTQTAIDNATVTAEAQSTQNAESTQIAVDNATATAETIQESTTEAESTESAMITQTAEFEFQLTVDAQATEEANEAAIEQMTVTAEVAALATIDAQALQNAQATDDAVATEDAEIIAETEAAANIPPTEAPTDTLAPTEAPTDTIEPTEAPTDTVAPTEAPTDTIEPTEAPTDTVAPTEEEPTEETIQPTPTEFDPTSTPVGELTDIETGTPPEANNNLPIIVIAVVVALLLIILVIVISRGRNE